MRARARHLAEAPAAWSASGVVRVRGRHLVFEHGDQQRHTSLSTIESTQRAGLYLWVRRRRAHDWLIRFEDADDAERIEADLHAAVR